MPSIQRILHPTDFSKYSSAAAAYASLLARQFHADLHLLFVVEGAMAKIPEPNLGFPAPGERVEARLEHMPRLQSIVGVDVEDPGSLLLATRMGPIAEQIVSYANDSAIDMIVIGTHGRRGLAHALMGSVAEAVVRKAGRPVLTVGPGKPAAE